jgi:hypothetical protein
MRKTLATFAALAMASALMASSAHGMGVSGGGGRLGIADPEAGNSGPAVGAHVELESAGSRWHLEPNVLYWSGEPMTGFDTNLDGFYHFGAEHTTTPYLGGGVGVSIVDRADANSTSDAGVNMLGGVRFPSGHNDLFIEGRYQVRDVNQASLTFGATFK